MWTVKENTQAGSWMWRKILECREVAKKLYRVEVKNGKKAYFWHEAWSSLGCLKYIFSDGSHINMGIPINATVDASRKHIRKYHRVIVLNRVEEEIEKYKANIVQEEDISLWENGKGQYKMKFSTNETWKVIRERH